MSVTSLTSHNIVFPQERTIQVEETQNRFNKDEAKSFDHISSISTFFVQLRQLPIMCYFWGFPAYFYKSKASWEMESLVFCLISTVLTNTTC